MSFYSADALPRAITDLEGVLCAGGVMTLFGRGSAARLAIVLGAPPLCIVVPDDEPPDEEAVPVPVTGTVRDQRVPGGLPAAGGAPPVAVDHEVGWDEGVDEIPDDELPVRDEDDDLGSAEAHEPAARARSNGHHAAPDDATPADTTPDDAAPDDADHGQDLPRPATPGVVAPDPVVEWRAHALCCAFRGRGVPAEVERLPDGRPVVRSAYRADLVGLATVWRAEDGSPVVPTDLELDGPRLRLWVLAAGRRRGRAYTLGLDPHAPATHEPLLTACQRAGLGATLAGDEDDPVVEILGQRRQRRLAELVGDRPRSLAEGVWPE